MKIIDLLNKIANGEEFKKVEIEYFDHNSLCRDKCYLKENEIIYKLYYGNLELNEEVEILEEEKKIPEKWNDLSFTTMRNQKDIETLKGYIETIMRTQNEIIDYLKSKGDE